MSRIGNKLIPIPAGVDVRVADGLVVVKGKHGELKQQHHERVAVQVDGGQVKVTRRDDSRQNRALHGLTRALIANMVQGVVAPFEKKLEIVGIGYQASLKQGALDLQVGYANIISLPVPPNVQCELTDSTHIVVRSTDKQAVGQFAAVIRNVRPPEPYKGKGIRYAGEHVRRKSGKAFAGSGSK